MELIIADGLFSWRFPLQYPGTPLTCMCVHQVCGSAGVYSSLLKKKGSIVWVCRWGSEPKGGSAPAHPLILGGLGTEMIQGDGMLSVFKAQQPLSSWKLQVFSALAPYMSKLQHRAWKRAAIACNCCWKERLQWFTRQLPNNPRQQQIGESCSPLQHSTAPASTALIFLPFTALFVQFWPCLVPVEINFFYLLVICSHNRSIVVVIEALQAGDRTAC